MATKRRRNAAYVICVTFNYLILLEKDGGRSRARTYDPLIKSQLLYQLSYAPIFAVRQVVRSQ